MAVGSDNKASFVSDATSTKLTWRGAGRFDLQFFKTQNWGIVTYGSNVSLGIDFLEGQAFSANATEISALSSVFKCEVLLSVIILKID